MTSALIGYTGFVGSDLLRQGQFTDLYNSKNIGDIRGKSYERIVCAGAPGAKWQANDNPEADFDNITKLIHGLADCEAELVTLISTVDVLGDTSYGLHRKRLEDFVALASRDYRIVRLPALFGTGLRKNVLYDLMHEHRLNEINPDSQFQWYPISYLGSDLAEIESGVASLVTLATEPIATSDIVARFFPDVRLRRKYAGIPVIYNHKPYRMTREQVLAEMGKFIEEERRGRKNLQRVGGDKAGVCSEACP